MRNKIPLACITVLLIGILVLGTFGCGDSSTTAPTTTSTSSSAPSTTTSAAQEPKYGGTLRIISTNAALGNIGVPWTMTQAAAVLNPCIDHLINMDFNGNIQPVLATDWKIADDGMSITFTLRQGVKFQDGTDFDAAAEKWNLEKWWEAHQPGTENWVSVEVVDTYTIRINLTEYKISVLSGLAGDYCAPI